MLQYSTEISIHTKEEIDALSKSKSQATINQRAMLISISNKELPVLLRNKSSLCYTSGKMKIEFHKAGDFFHYAQS